MMTVSLVVALDNPRVTGMKNGTKSLSFTVIQKDEVTGWPLAILTNWRVMDGMIHGPASYSRKTRQYYQTCWLYGQVAKMVYVELIAKGWVTQYELFPLLAPEYALAPITLTPDAARIAAPSLLQQPPAAASV